MSLPIGNIFTTAPLVGLVDARGPPDRLLRSLVRVPGAWHHGHLHESAKSIAVRIVNSVKLGAVTDGKMLHCVNSPYVCISLPGAMANTQSIDT